jgi:arylformamidase
MKIIDITVPLSPELARYPGDQAFELVPLERMADGAPYNCTRLNLGSHTGTHVDAPYHFVSHGLTAEALALEILIGKARVMELSVLDSVGRPDLEAFDLRDDLRVLLKTRMSGQMRNRVFHHDHVHLTPDAARYLVQAGIKLVGVDYLSVDPHAGGSFPAHQVLLEAGVIVVEGLDLSEVEPGEYELICLPLPIVGGDGAPARAVLRTRL